MRILEAESKAGRTVIATTHDLASAAHHFHQAAFVNGRIVAFGPAELVLDPALLTATYGGHVLVLPAGRADDHRRRPPSRRRPRRRAPLPRRGGLTMLDLILDPLAYGFMQRGLVAAVLVGIVCAVMGAFVVLRGLAFIGDAVSHAAFPGLVIAYMLGIPLYLGGAVAAVGTALAIGVVARRGALRFDTAVGVLFAGTFALRHPAVQHDPGLRRRPVRLPARATSSGSRSRTSSRSPSSAAVVLADRRAPAQGAAVRVVRSRRARRRPGCRS